MGRPPVYINASPRPTYIIARVMIKGGMPPRLMPRPLVSPAAVPIPSPTTINAIMPKRWKDATKTTTSPTIDPTERSMPAVMITKVMPRAMMPVMEICLSTFKIFVGRRNTGERNAATKTSVRNAMRTPYRSSAPVNEKVPMRESAVRSEEHTSELQSRLHLVCRLLLEKKKTQKNINYSASYYMRLFKEVTKFRVSNISKRSLGPLRRHSTYGQYVSHSHVRTSHHVTYT